MTETNTVDFLLIVDHKWRDLPGMAAMRVWLEDGFGCSAELIRYDQWAGALMQYRPQAIVLTHMNGSRSQLIARIARTMGTRVVVIQTEGRPNNIETMEYTSGRFAELRHVDVWFTWSETVRDFMLARNLLPADQIVVGGVHRFDIYRPDLDRTLLSRSKFAHKYHLDTRQPIVSWATNFTHAKFHTANQEFLLRDWQDLGMTKLPSLADPLEFARMDWMAREESLKVMRALIESRPELQFIVKPHPAEELDRYRVFVDECRRVGANITLVFHDYVWDVLNAVDVHIHRLCTTGVEAWLLAVPTIELHLFDYGTWSAELPGAAAEAMNGNDVVATAADLIEKVDYYLRGGRPTSTQLAARDQYIKRWLYHVDGKRCRAHARVLSELIQEPRDIKPFPLGSMDWRTQTKLRLNHQLRRPLDAPIRFWRNTTPGGSDYLGQVDKRITPEDARLWTCRAREALGRQIEAYQLENAGKNVD